MKSRSTELVDRAIAAMLSAIEIYNKPRFIYRLESFCVLSINAWELLLKAKWLKDHNNKESSLYMRRKTKGENRSRRNRFEKTCSGVPKTYSLSFLVKAFIQRQVIDKNVQKNIEAINEFRNFSVHYYFKNRDAIALKLQEIGLATVKNFSTLVFQWFSRDLSEFESILLPLALTGDVKKYSSTSSQEERRFVEYLNSCERDCVSSDGRFSVSVKINFSFSRDKTSNALPVCITNDPSAQKIVLSDDQILEKYPLSYDMLIKEMKKRYSNFIQNNEFNKYKRRVELNAEFCMIRKLDPRSKKNFGKKFYSYKVLNEFDKYYTRCS